MKVTMKKMKVTSIYPASCSCGRIDCTEYSEYGIGSYYAMKDGKKYFCTFMDHLGGEGKAKVGQYHRGDWIEDD